MRRSDPVPKGCSLHCLLAYTVTWQQALVRGVWLMGHAGPAVWAGYLPTQSTPISAVV
jgi:hypothetical protein